MSRETLALLPAWVFLFILPFTHTVALRLLALFAASAVAVWQWRQMRTLRFAMAPPAWPCLVFWAVLPLALAPFAVDPVYSLGEFKTEVVYGLLAFGVFFVGVRSERVLRGALYSLFAAYAAMTLWALAARLHLGTWNEASYFGGTASFSVYLVTVLPLAVVALERRLFDAPTPAVVALILVLGLASGLFTEQRGLWPAFAAQGLALLLLSRRAGLWRPRPAVLWGAAALVVFIAAAAMFEASNRRFGMGSGAGMLADTRLANWTQVLGWIAERPLTGYGFGRGTMAKAFPEMWGRSDMFWHAHNLVLDYGVQLGLPGLLAILGVFGGLLASWLGASRSEDAVVRAAGVAGALVVTGVFVRNMTNDLFQRDLSLLFWSLNGLLAGFVASRSKVSA